MNTENGTNRGNPQQRAHNVAPQKTPANGAKRKKSPVQTTAPKKGAGQGRPQRSAPKAPPTPEQLARYEKIKKIKQQKKQQKRERRVIFVIRLFAALLAYIFVLGCTALLVFALYSSNFGTSNALHIKYSENENPKKIAASTANIDGVMYISATDLGLVYSFTLAGDKQQVTLYFHGIDQSLSLFKDSAVVEINGSPIRLGAKILFTDDYYIPLELIETYFYGANIDRSEEGKVVIIRTSDDDGFYLRVQAPSTTEPVS